MRKKNLGWLLVLVLVLALTACGSKDFKTYENKELGFSLDLPKSWEGKYLVEEDPDRDLVYFMHISNSRDYENGMLFSIDRRVGGLITEEDIENGYVPGEIIGKEAGYTFIKGLPTDIQYGPEAVVDTKEYEEMRSELPDVLKTFKIGELKRPRGEEAGYIKEGSSFFLLDIREDWKLEKDKKNPFKWDVLNGDGKIIGSLEMVLYDSQDQEEAGRKTAYKTQDEIFRKFRISLDKEYEKDLDLMARSLEILGDNYTALDGIYNLRTNLTDGGKSLVGRIKSLEKDIKIVNKLELVVEDSGEVYSFEAEYPEIVPLEGETYGLYGVYLLGEDIIKKEGKLDKSLFEFIINKYGKLVGLIEL